jgi:hypothetical protein
MSILNPDLVDYNRIMNNSKSAFECNFKFIFIYKILYFDFIFRKKSI